MLPATSRALRGEVCFEGQQTRTPRKEEIMMTTEQQQQIITETVQSQLDPLRKQLEKVRAEFDGVATELIARCQYAEDRADEVFHRFLDLMDALDELDVIRVLEQHFPDDQRYRVDRLADQIASLWRSFE
jgi:molecular chaperone GrpE (heat shock protein)